MTSILQKACIALAGALDLKVGGRNPDKFGDTVLPTVEVFDQYLAGEELQRASTAAFNLAIAATNAAANLSVPPGKAWRVLGAGLASNVNVADAALLFDCVISVNQPGLTPPVVIFAQTMNGSTLSRLGGLYFARPLFLPAGWALVFQIFARGAAPTVAISNVGSALVQEFDL